MAVVRPTGMRVNYPIIFISGIILVVSSVLVFLLVLKAVYGNFELDDILPTKANINAFYSGKDVKTAILYSKYTENILPEGSTWLIDNINAWERYIGSRNIDYDLIDDDEIAINVLQNYDILILPGSKALSDRQVIAIKKYLENGGSLFATSGPATYSIEGKWKGWERTRFGGKI